MRFHKIVSSFSPSLSFARDVRGTLAGASFSSRLVLARLDVLFRRGSSPRRVALYSARFISPPPFRARFEITVRVRVPSFSRRLVRPQGYYTGSYGLILMHPRSPRAVAVANTRERDPVSRKREEERRRRLPIRLRRRGVSCRFQYGPAGDARGRASRRRRVTRGGCSCCQTDASP